MDLAYMQLYVGYIWFVQRNLNKLYDPGQEKYVKMKNFVIRTFVVALAVAGFSASSMYSASTARANNVAKIVVSQPGVVKTPSPQCGPGSTCGLD
jgi:hypothetical protein